MRWWVSRDLPFMITQEGKTIHTPNNEDSNRGHLAQDLDKLKFFVSFNFFFKKCVYCQDFLRRAEI
jgi:hypothetical protein